MLKSFFDAVKILLGLTEDTQKNKADIKALQAKDEVISFTLQQLASDITADRRIAAEQRENLLLRLENVLLKSGNQRALPPGASAQNTGDHEARIAALEQEVAELKRRLAEQDER